MDILFLLMLSRCRDGGFSHGSDHLSLAPADCAARIQENLVLEAILRLPDAGAGAMKSASARNDARIARCGISA